MTYKPRPNLDWSWNPAPGLEAITVDARFITDLLEYVCHLEDTLREHAPQELEAPPVEPGTPIHINLNRHTVTAGTETVPLTRDSRILLEYLARHPGQTIPRETIRLNAWPRPGARTVIVGQLHRIRAVTAAVGAADPIWTDQGKGLRLAENVTIEGL